MSDAARKLGTSREVIKNPLPAASGLFQDRLAEWLRWIAEKDLAAQQHALARQSLERADYVRAAAFAWEALVTRECTGFPPYTRETREAAQKTLDEKFTGIEAYSTLKYLRNALAHGTPPEDRRLRALLGSPEPLREALRRAIQCLLP